MSGFRGAKKPTWSTQAATGAAVVAILDSHKTPGIDAATFGMSALIVLFGVEPGGLWDAKERPGLPCGPYRLLVFGLSSVAACC